VHLDNLLHSGLPVDTRRILVSLIKPVANTNKAGSGEATTFRHPKLDETVATYVEQALGAERKRGE
jgi:hypothetical protein